MPICRHPILKRLPWNWITRDRSNQEEKGGLSNMTAKRKEVIYLYSLIPGKIDALASRSDAHS